MDSMLGIGRKVGPVTYRGIVGDTTQWKKEHIDDILDMCRPAKRKIVKDLAGYYGVHEVEVLENLAWWVKRLREEDLRALIGFRWDTDDVPELNYRRSYPRRKARRPALAPRRPGEARLTGRRYAKPDPLVPRIVALPPARATAMAVAAE